MRLRALADAPTAFGSTLAEAQEHPDDVWRERVAGPNPVALAFTSGTPVAMGGLFVPEESGDGFVWGMWTAPEARGRGVGTQILQALLTHPRAHGRDVVLHVTEGNDDARGLYVANGFETTGEWQPLRDGSALRVETMKRPVRTA